MRDRQFVISYGHRPLSWSPHRIAHTEILLFIFMVLITYGLVEERVRRFADSLIRLSL